MINIFNPYTLRGRYSPHVIDGDIGEESWKAAELGLDSPGCYDSETIFLTFMPSVLPSSRCSANNELYKNDVFSGFYTNVAIRKNIEQHCYSSS